MLFICGQFFGLRGIAKHTDLMTEHLELGEYPPNHVFEGKPSVGFNGMAYKHHRLGINRSVIENSETWRVPVLDFHSKKDPGGTILRYQAAWGENQIRFHCKPLTKKC